MKQREALRLYGKELFVVVMKADDEEYSFGYTNKRILADSTGIGYDNLVRIFTRNRRMYSKFIVGDKKYKVTRVFTTDISKGRQSRGRRGSIEWAKKKE